MHYWDKQRHHALFHTAVYTDVGVVFKWIDDQVLKWTGQRLTPASPPFDPVTGKSELPVQAPTSGIHD